MLKYMVRQRIARSMLVFFFFNSNLSFLCIFPLFSFSIIILQGLGSRKKGMVP